MRPPASSCRRDRLAMLGNIAPTVNAPLPAATSPLPPGTSPSHWSTARLENTAMLDSERLLRSLLSHYTRHRHGLWAPTEDDHQRAHDGDGCASQIPSIGTDTFDRPQPHQRGRDVDAAVGRVCSTGEGGVHAC